MRIVSYGHVKPKEMICKDCGAKYEYLPRDVQTFKPGTSSAKNFVRCPVCGNVAFVNIMLVKHDKYTVFKEEYNEQK